MGVKPKRNMDNTSTQLPGEILRHPGGKMMPELPCSSWRPMRGENCLGVNFREYRLEGTPKFRGSDQDFHMQSRAMGQKLKISTGSMVES